MKIYSDFIDIVVQTFLEKKMHILKKLLLFFFIGNPWFLAASGTIFPHNTNTIEPWFTGPLIAPIGEVVPVGHYIIQPFFEFNTITGHYDKHWKAQSLPNFFNYTTLLEVTIGITKWMDVQLNPTVLYNHTQNQDSWRFGDSPLTFDFQLLPTNKFKYFPGIKLALTESFPTGKYQRLNPLKLATDISSTGSFTTTPGLVFYKIYHFGGFHFLSMTASFGYTYYAPVHVRGFNFYGGGPGCAGKVYPGNSFDAIISFEFSLNRNWVLALDNVYVHFDKDRFRGTPGLSAVPFVPAIVGRPSSENLSFAPAIEYNFNENWGIIAGAWVSAIGRNTIVFRNALISFLYQY
jgi:hypothetical protein